MPLLTSSREQLGKILVSLAIHHPSILETCAEDLSAFTFQNAGLQKAVQLLLEKNDDTPLEKEALFTYF